MPDTSMKPQTGIMLRLTEDQHQLVEAAGGQPVDVLDPPTNRAYVLLPAELYPAIRAVLRVPEVPRPALPPEAEWGEPMRIKLRGLPTPPEVAESARQYAKKLMFWPSRSFIQELEDEAKLSYYFGGWAAVTLKSKEGPIVVAVGSVASEAFGRQLEAFTPEERRQKCIWFPDVWNDSSTPPRVLFTHDDSPSPGGA